MVRGLLTVLIGSALGALLVTALLRHYGTEIPRGAPFGAEQRTGLSRDDRPIEPFGAVTLDQLPEIADAIARREAAIVLFEDTDKTSADIDRIASMLPEDEGVNFRIHAIVTLGASDPQGAIGAAVALPEHEQRRLALLRLAPALAAFDPLGAIAAIGNSGSPDLETEFVAVLLDVWAELDPASVFSYLESTNQSRVPPTDATFESLAASNPERLLAIASTLRRDVATRASTAALDSLIKIDAPAALSRIANLRPGSDASRLRSTAIEAYGEQDPAAAWEWATETRADAFARSGVVRGIHKVDADLAWEIMESQWNSTDPVVRAGARDTFLNYVNIVVANSESTEAIMVGLDRILTLDGVQDTGNFMVNLQNWANTDPESALEWSLRNLDRINASSMLTALSSGLARTNLDLARQTIFRLDEPHDTSWVTGVTRTLAENDLITARAWAFEFPGGPLRDAGLHEVIGAEAQGGTVDRQLFEMFSSDAARSQAASRAARRFACDGKTTLALELAGAYITDRRLRDLTERQINGDPSAGNVTFACAFLR